MQQPQRDTDPPTLDRFRADISGERTGEKVNFPDPAAAPLGTDAEAAGHPPTVEERRMEAEARPEPRTQPEPSQGPVALYFGIIACIGIGLIIGIYAL